VVVSALSKLFAKHMNTVRLSLLMVVFGFAALGGCSSGQPTSSTAAPPATTPAGVPAESSATPPVSPEKAKEPEKEKEAPAAPERIEVDLETMISGLQSPVATQVFTAGEYFRQIPAAQRREVLLELSKHTDPNVRGNVWRVYSTVATKEDLATLSEASQSPFSDVQIAALETMARFPNEETIGVLTTKLLENPDYRELSIGLLSQIGPACESAVLPYASHADAAIRRAAWEVLVHAGTRKSVQALEQLTTQPQYEKEEPLKRSLEQLRERLRKS
jgi:hypothetical protein